VPSVEAVPASLDAILPLREEYRRAMGCQIVHDSYHERGFTDSYLLKVDREVVGYASVAGDPDPPRETVKELYVAPSHRGSSPKLFQALLVAACPRRIEAQTNDPFLRVPLFDSATSLRTDRVLFEDGGPTALEPPGVELRRIAQDEKRRVFEHTLVPVGDWALDRDGEVVASGGLLFHYNPPYGDIHMEVAAAHGDGAPEFIAAQGEGRDLRHFRGWARLHPAVNFFGGTHVVRAWLRWRWQFQDLRTRERTATSRLTRACSSTAVDARCSWAGRWSGRTMSPTRRRATPSSSS
jgi:hypothetical protein